MKVAIYGVEAMRCVFAPLRSIVLAVGAVTALSLAWTDAASGQVPIVYPGRGQSMQQQAADESECRAWAQQQTGTSSMNAPQRQGASSAGGGQVLRGAAGGAALGAVGGAIAGNAGKGAAIGAGIGAAAGLLGRRRQQAAADQRDVQTQQAYNASMAQYDRAFGACMSGRGYTVN